MARALGELYRDIFPKNYPEGGAMLNSLKLTNVGPSPKMEIHFKPRMNLLTGDNGLGKTFLLDIAWWVLTRTWARMPAIPPAISKRESFRTPRIHFKYRSGTGPRSFVER